MRVAVLVVIGLFGSYLVGVLKLLLWFSNTDKKENQIFLTYKEIQNGVVANVIYDKRPPLISD
jgi:hypothetical protein